MQIALGSSEWGGRFFWIPALKVQIFLNSECTLSTYSVKYSAMQNRFVEYSAVQSIAVKSCKLLNSLSVSASAQNVVRLACTPLHTQVPTSVALDPQTFLSSTANYNNFNIALYRLYNKPGVAEEFYKGLFHYLIN